MSATANLRPVETGPADESYRTPPQNLEAEQALLGAILVNNEACDKVSGFLQPEHFFEPLHARIFEAASTLIKIGKLATPVTLRSYFENDATMREIGGPAYLARLAANATTIINAEEYGRTVYELAQRRKLIGVGTELVNEAFDPDIEDSSRDLIERAEQTLYAMAETGKYGQGFQPFARALTDAVDMAASAYQRDGGLSGISTGLKDLDEKMGGLAEVRPHHPRRPPRHGQDLARHQHRLQHRQGLQGGSQGGWLGGGEGRRCRRLLLAGNVGRAARHPHHLRAGDDPVGAHPPRQDHGRGIRQDRGRDARDAVAAALYRRDGRPHHRAGRGARQASEAPAGPGASRGRLSPAPHRLLASRRRRPRAGSLEITVGLKALAKELAVPIIALSQLSRQVENRDDKRPQLADLRESGSIEQDADVVLFVYREEYYLARKEPRPNTQEHFDWQEQMNRVNGVAEVIIGKQRHGPTGIVELQFEASLTKFQNLVRTDYLPERFE